MRLRRAQPITQGAQRGQVAAGMFDGVDADVRLRPVGGPSPEGGLDPHEAFVSRHDRQAGGLAHHRGVGPHPGADQSLHSQAGVLLVRGEGHHQYPGKRVPSDLGRGSQQGRHAPFHVARSPTPEPPILQFTSERLDAHSSHPHGIEMTVEEEGRADADALEATHHVPAARRYLGHFYRQAPSP